MKTFFLKVMLQIGLKKFFVIKKIKNTVINDLSGEEIIGTFYEKNCERKSRRNYNIQSN